MHRAMSLKWRFAATADMWLDLQVVHCVARRSAGPHRLVPHAWFARQSDAATVRAAGSRSWRRRDCRRRHRTQLQRRHEHCWAYAPGDWPQAGSAGTVLAVGMVSPT